MTRFIRMERRRGQWLCAMLCSVAFRPALAESISREARPQAVQAETDVSLGRALFDRGRALYEADQLDEACEAFAQSHSMRPNTSALLALATCHRDQRRLGSARAEFMKGHSRAQRENDAALEKYAEDELGALQDRLSTIFVEVPPAVAEIPGLELEVDGYFIEVAAWNVAVPYDGGEHTISARAPGRHTWRTTKTLQPVADALRVPVPVLEEDERAQERPPIGLTPFSFAPHDAPAAGAVPWGPLEGWGVASMGVGAISLGMMVPILMGALDKDQQFEASSGHRREQLRLDARARGNRATAFGVAGAVFAGTGIGLFLTGRARSQHAAAERELSVSLKPRADGLTVSVGGTL